jgi:hypothetical protein
MKDWRGTEVKVGDTVLYATRGGSWMRMVEGVVESIYDDDSAMKVRITRRQGGGYIQLVTVSNNYLTVVSLPPSTEPTLAEKVAESLRLREELKAKQAACEHTNWDTAGYGYRICKDCRKVQYGNYYPEGYSGRSYHNMKTVF